MGILCYGALYRRDTSFQSHAFQHGLGGGNGEPHSPENSLLAQTFLHLLGDFHFLLDHVLCFSKFLPWRVLLKNNHQLKKTNNY